MKKQNMIFGLFISTILAISTIALHKFWGWSVGASSLVFPGSLIIAYCLAVITKSSYLDIENTLASIYDNQNNGIIGDQELLKKLSPDTSIISWNLLFLKTVGFFGLFTTAHQIVYWIGSSGPILAWFNIQSIPEIYTFNGMIIYLSLLLPLIITFHYLVKPIKIIKYPTFKVKTYKYNVETLQALLPPELMKEVTEKKINLDAEPYSQFFYVDTENSTSNTGYLASLYLGTITEKIIINIQKMNDFKNKKKTDQANELENIKRYLKLSDISTDH